MDITRVHSPMGNPKGHPPEDAETQRQGGVGVWDPLFHFSDKVCKGFKNEVAHI
jgi:hypothetical protein